MGIADAAPRGPFPASHIIACLELRLAARNSSSPRRRGARARQSRRSSPPTSTQFDDRRRFDRIVSVEMLEHVRNHARLFAGSRRWLEPTAASSSTSSRIVVRLPFDAGGEQRLDVAAFLHRRNDAERRPVSSTCSRISLVDEHWRIDGTHYQRTAEAWLGNFDRNAAAIERMLAGAIRRGPGERWRVRWRVFFMACAEMFGWRRRTGMGRLALSCSPGGGTVKADATSWRRWPRWRCSTASGWASFMTRLLPAAAWHRGADGQRRSRPDLADRGAGLSRHRHRPRAVRPAARAQAGGGAVLGAAFGAITFAIYDLTNHATLREWRAADDRRGYLLGSGLVRRGASWLARLVLAGDNQSTMTKRPLAAETYPIRAVARMTGLSVDTLRAWERRYEAVAPRPRRSRPRPIPRPRRAPQAAGGLVARGHAIGTVATLPGRGSQAPARRLGRTGHRDATEAPAASTRRRVMDALERYDLRRSRPR